MATPKVAPWPAIPIAKPDEVYAGLSDQAKDYPLFLESIVRQEHNFEKPEALARLRVLDCSTRMMIGHWCSSMLSELGAAAIPCAKTLRSAGENTCSRTKRPGRKSAGSSSTKCATSSPSRSTWRPRKAATS